MNRLHLLPAGLLFAVAAPAAAQKAQTPQTPQTPQISAPMAIPAQVTEARVNVRKGPGSDFERFTLLDENAKVMVVEKQGSWSKVRMGDGRTGWIGAQYLRRDPSAPAPTSDSISTADSISTSVSNSNSNSKPSATTNSTKNTNKAALPAATPPIRHSATLDPASAPVSALLLDTKKDPFASGSGIGVGVGDAFRLLLTLLPVLGLVVLAVRGLKRFQERTGTLPRLPNIGGSVLGGFNLSNSRRTAGSNIRVIESLPVGRMELSLVEVRGRLLLLACSGGSVTLLTEMKSGAELNPESEFQSLLGHYAEDDPEDLDGTIGATVGSLDDSLREAREAIVQSAQKTLRKTSAGRRAVERQDIDPEWQA